MAIGREGNVKWVDVSLGPRFLLVSGLESFHGIGTDDGSFPVLPRNSIYIAPDRGPGLSPQHKGPFPRSSLCGRT